MMRAWSWGSSTLSSRRSERHSAGCSLVGLAARKAWSEQVDATSRLRWEWVRVIRAEKARDVFFRHRDKDNAFTDYTDLVVSQELELRQPVTTDEHFRRMGFYTAPGLPTRRASAPLWNACGLRWVEGRRA